jgi:hypothetical protein
MIILHITDSNAYPEVRCKVKLILEQNMKIQRGCRGISVLFNLAARWGG